MTGVGPIGRGGPGRGSRPPTPVAEAGHDLGGAFWEDELLSQLHVGPAFSWRREGETHTLDSPAGVRLQLRGPRLHPLRAEKLWKLLMSV